MTYNQALFTPIPRSVKSWRTWSITGSSRRRKRARRSASSVWMCAVRKPTCCHARLRRVRRADGSGAPSHCCTWSSWASTSPCKVSCTPWPANKPLMRLMTRVRSCFAVVSSRWSCRRSSSSTLGTRTTLHTFCSPALWRSSIVRSLRTSSRSVLARRWRRLTSILAESMTWFWTLCATK
jgi:hypothetical protein